MALGRLPYAILLEVRVSDGSLAPGRCGRDSPKIPGVVRAWARPRLLIPKPASPFTCPEPHTIPHLAVPRFLAVGPFLMGPIECLKEFVTPDTDIKVLGNAKWHPTRRFLLLTKDRARILEGRRGL